MPSGGVRFYFGQRDKTLIDRHRQDDPTDSTMANGTQVIQYGIYGFNRARESRNISHGSQIGDTVNIE